MKNQSRPPFFFHRLLKRFCRPDFYEELQGDLNEAFERNCIQFGERKARSIYRKEVLRLIRPSAVKPIRLIKPKNQPAMFKNYTLVAFRTLSKNKLFTSINIIGLSISMAIGLIAIAFVTEVYSFDKFHENKDQIYRIVSEIERPNRGDARPFATAPLMTGDILKNDFAGDYKIASIQRSLYGAFELEKGEIPIEGIFTNNDFFEIFSFDLLSGDPKTALDDPYSVVLTETTATNLFGHTNVLGKILDHSFYNQMTVTGVVKDPPYNSHIKFEAIASLEMLKARDSWVINTWGQSTAGYTYILYPEENDLAQLQANLDQISANQNGKIFYNVNLGLEAFNDIYPHTGRANQFGVIIEKEIINDVIILAAIVIISACFNYMNLSMARSLKRAKEVGVRKVVGAKRRQLLVQFIMESVLVSLLALGISILLFKLIRPEFLKINIVIERTTSLFLTGEIYLYFLLMAIVVGILSGLVPALLMSKFNPAIIIKGASTLRVSKGLDIRKIIIGIQFVFSMGFLILVNLAYKQYMYSVNYDLGFNTENVLNIDVQRNDIDLLRSAFANIPEVTGISTASMTASTGQYQTMFVKFDPADSTESLTFDVSVDFIGNLGHRLVAGSNFSEGMTTDRAIISEMLVKELGFDSNQDAIDKSIQMGRESYIIQGVVEDFQARTIDDTITPFIFTCETREHWNLNVKIATTNIASTMVKLENAWSSVDDKNEFSAMFYEDEIKRAYSQVSAAVKTYGSLAIIAIAISIMGLFGMAVYTTESRIKELSIRKVLGASVKSLVTLLSKSFLGIFIIAASAAIPIAYVIFQRAVVADKAYKISVGVWELSSGALVIIIIAFLTICSQTINAAKTNPADHLRNE